MDKGRVLETIGHAVRGGDEAGPRRFRGKEEFRVLVIRERHRADRSGQCFSFVTFGGSAINDRLLELLCRRSRSIDALGWFDDRRLAILMPYTKPDGAQLFVDSLAQELGGSREELECKIYTYPSESSSDKDDEFPDLEVHSDQDAASTSQDPAAGGAARLRIVREERAHQAIEDLDFMFVKGLPLWKRVMDIVGASLGLVVLSPLMLVVMLAIKLTSRGPVIFKQQRAGLGGRPFTFYKFRTMRDGADSEKVLLRAQNEVSGPVFKMKKDPRITKVGYVLRRTSIDEVPQLWNVLLGDMSLVGPRPPTLDETVHYDPWHRRRLELTPGLTGLWQVSGRSTIGFQEWVRLDVRYAEKCSIGMDLRILARTVVAVLTARGAA